MCLSVICCVYVSTDSYLSIHTHPSLEAHELLRIVGLKMDRAEEDMVLAVVSHTGGMHANTQNKTYNTYKLPFGITTISTMLNHYLSVYSQFIQYFILFQLLMYYCSSLFYPLLG